MESTVNTLLLTPIFLPIMQSIGMDPVHFGILMMTIVTMGGMTPPRRCNHVYRVLFDERICQELYERVGAIFSRGINSRDTFNGVSTSRAIFTEPAYGLKKGVIVLSQMLSIPGSGGPCSP